MIRHVDVQFAVRSFSFCSFYLSLNESVYDQVCIEVRIKEISAFALAPVSLPPGQAEAIW